MKRLKATKGGPSPQEDKFEGNGMMFKCKLFGMMDVPRARGDDICREAMFFLKQQSLISKKKSGSHKQRIFLNLSVKGIRIIDEKTRKMEHGHPVHRISYISHDVDDKRTFGYIVSLEDGYKFFSFRTEKAATLLTANLKDLFQSVYQKYKSKRESGEAQPSQGAEGMEEGVEADTEEDAESENKDTEAFYAVPDKITLVETPKTKDSLTPPQQPAVANLLDWSDVNDHLEEINQGMKRSDTSELLSGVDQLNFSTAIPDDLPSPTASQPPQNSDPFTSDPFFKSENDGSMRMSASDSDIKNLSNPFLSTGGSDPFAPADQTSISKCKSLEIFSIEQTSAGTQMNNQRDLFDEEKFQPQTSLSAQPSALNDLFSLQPTDTFSGDVLVSSEPAMQPSVPAVPVPDPVCLEPSRKDKNSNADPFSLLSGDIQGMKGTLPTGGTDVPSFPQQKTKTAMQSAPLRVASGPTIPPNPQGNAGNNPFVTNSQAYSNTSQRQFPQIPPRVDLYNMQSPTNMGQRPNSPFGMQQNPSQMVINQPGWGNYGGNPMINQPQNQFRPDIPARQDLPFVAGPHSSPVTDDLYATVNKPKQQQDNMLGDFGVQQSVASKPSKDPFGDLGDFGF